MKRAELLKSKEYWLIQIQNDLFGILEEYLKKENINKTQLAQKLKVTKGYISQIFNGDFDHKISKMVELSLVSGNVPILSFVDINKYIKEDANDKIFELIPILRPKIVEYKKESSFLINDETKKQNEIKDTPTLIVNNNQQPFSMLL